MGIDVVSTGGDTNEHIAEGWKMCGRAGDGPASRVRSASMRRRGSVAARASRSNALSIPSGYRGGKIRLQIVISYHLLLIEQ